MEFDTKLIHGGISEDKYTGATSVPILYGIQLFINRRLVKTNTNIPVRVTPPGKRLKN